VGGGARGAWALPEHYFVPNFGGPNEEESGMIDALKKFAGAAFPDLGDGYFANLFEKLVKDLPKQLFDFLIKKVPQIVFDAIKDAVVDLFTRDPQLRGTAAFADGGTTRPGPIVVGERGPELMWANGGEYILSNSDSFGRGGRSAPLIGHAEFHNDVDVDGFFRAAQFHSFAAA
jgi:hypothetical protein